MIFSRLFRLLAFCALITSTTSIVAQIEVDRQTTKPLAPPSMDLDSASNDSSDMDTETESDNQPIQLALNFDASKLLEEIRVTGTYIKGIQQEDLPTPLNSLDRDAIRDIGAFKPADLINNLTINTGSENNSDAFTQNFTTGTSNINLRGLGVASTLVLLNSRRQTYSALTTDNGENFVDTSSLVPMIAIDRIEILKDGAASLYGSDAVGGVVNFLTRNEFEGAEISLDYLSGSGTQQDSTLSAIYGVGSESLHFMAAFSLFDRDGLSTADHRLSKLRDGSISGDDESIVGFPGSFLVPARPTFPSLLPAQAAPLTGAWDLYYDGVNSNGIADFFEGLSATPPIFSDLNCPAVASISSTTIAPETYPLGLCGFDFGGYYSVVPEEERMQFYSSFSANFSDSLKFEAELALAENEAKRNNSPSFPIARQLEIPWNHPNNPFGVPVNFIGRTLASGYDPTVTTHTSDTLRFMAALEGTIGTTWTWTADITLSSNEFSLMAEDTLASEFEDALNGIGTDCDTVPSGCSFYNPFAEISTTPNTNSADMLDFVTGDFLLQAEAELTTFGALFSGQVFDLTGGPASAAFGLQFRDETLDYNYDENANNNNYLFFIGNPDFNTSRDAVSLFGELSMPFYESFMMQLSIRAEDYGDDVDSIDPKLAMLWKPVDSVALRASLSTSFRAPSLFQQNGIQTSLEQIQSQFLPVRAQANPLDPLQPEEADVFNLGVTWSMDSKAGQSSFSADYWSYDYEQVIIQQNANAIFSTAFNPAADPALRTQALNQIDFVGGVVNPLTVELINVFYDNASTLATNGIDLTLSQNWDTDRAGNFLLALELTRVLEYDLEDPQAGKVDGLGSRNFVNFGTSSPELRAVLQLGWGTELHTVNLFARHIDSYMDDQNNNANIASHTTFDVQYRYSFAATSNDKDGISIAVGGINVTDEKPPYVATNGGFDSKVHDPRGALYYVNLGIPF